MSAQPDPQQHPDLVALRKEIAIEHAKVAAQEKRLDYRILDVLVPIAAILTLVGVLVALAITLIDIM